MAVVVVAAVVVVVVVLNLVSLFSELSKVSRCLLGTGRLMIWYPASFFFLRRNHVYIWPLDGFTDTRSLHRFFIRS